MKLLPVIAIFLTVNPPEADRRFEFFRQMTIEESQQCWFVYVLRNPDGKLYIGQTQNLSFRLHQHNDPKHTLTRTTKRFRGPWEIVHSETVPSRLAALAREKALKSGQGRAWLTDRLGC